MHRLGDTVLGLTYGQVRLVDSDPGWPRAFELLAALEDRPAHRIAHLHVVPHGGERWRRYLAFRDRLRTDPDARAAYSEAKRRLGEQFAGDRQAYTAGKAAFVAWLLSVE